MECRRVEGKGILRCLRTHKNKRMKNICGISLMLILCCGLSVHGQELYSSSPINSIFTKVEIEDLEDILTFFSDQICTVEQLDTNYIKNCYFSYCERLKVESTETGIIDLKIPFDKQRILYKTIDDSTFYQIWSFGTYLTQNTSEPLVGIQLNPHGKYAAFLKSLGQEYQNVNEYYNDLVATGDIAPSMTAELLINYNDFNLPDQRIKLLMAIHYLTLNDQLERNERD